MKEEFLCSALKRTAGTDPASMPGELVSAADTFQVMIGGHQSIVKIFNSKTILFAFIIVWTASISCASRAAATLPARPSDLTLFTINEFDSASDALSLSSSAPSQNWVRAWFKWANAPDLRGLGYMVQQAHAYGALFGGGVTCSALYKNENGITDSQFMGLATRDPDGHLFLISKSYYHGSVENPAYRLYVLHWAEQQIDAGVDTLFMDEVNGAYSVHEGFDTYGLAAFRRYLIHRFITEDHWSNTDPRWSSRFHINLNNELESPDGTIQTFDYAAYLRQNHWDGQPDNGDNPLSSIWGEPGDITNDTYSAHRNNSVWHYWVTELRKYAQKKHHRVWIAANGLNRWVDYQIIGCPWNFQRYPDGQLSCTGSNLPYWRSAYEQSRVLMKGKDVPIMTFNDWGEGMPWMNLTSSERAAWLDAYAPEVFACGIFFAYPVHGPFGCDASTDGTLSVIQKQARFAASVATLLHRVVWQDPNAARYNGKAEITIQSQPDRKKLIIHLINRDYSGLSPSTQTTKLLHIAIAIRPLNVTIHNADTGEVSAASWKYNSLDIFPERRTGGTLSVTIPSLKTWDIVEINLPRWAAMPAPTDITIPCSLYWARPAENQFSINSTQYPRSYGLNGFIQGNLHPDLRNNPTFVVRFTMPGKFEVHVNSTAETGSHLVICVDGKQVLQSQITNSNKKE